MKSTDIFFEFFNFSENTFINTFSMFATTEFFTVLFLFNFLQLLVLSVISELIWPTQLFNRQNTIGFTAYRLRTFTETLVKLRSYTVFYKTFNKFFIKKK